MQPYRGDPELEARFQILESKIDNIQKSYKKETKRKRFYEILYKIFGSDSCASCWEIRSGAAIVCVLLFMLFSLYGVVFYTKTYETNAFYAFLFYMFLNLVFASLIKVYYLFNFFLYEKVKGKDPLK